MDTIKEARQAANLTQRAMAEALGIPIRSIQDWESNRRTPPPYVKALIINELIRIKEKTE